MGEAMCRSTLIDHIPEAPRRFSRIPFRPLARGV